MTESKQDIQAQIDQLDAEWEKHEIGQAKDRKVIILSAICLLLLAIYGWRPSLSLGWGLFLALPILLVVNQYMSSRRVSMRATTGDGGLTADQYETKRIELQAKLDALD